MDRGSNRILVVKMSREKEREMCPVLLSDRDDGPSYPEAVSGRLLHYDLCPGAGGMHNKAKHTWDMGAASCAIRACL